MSPAIKFFAMNGNVISYFANISDDDVHAIHKSYKCQKLNMNSACTNLEWNDDKFDGNKK